MLAITGGTGFIGSYLLPRINEPYRSLVRNTYNTHSDIDIIGCMENADDVTRLVVGCNTLLHMASTNTPRNSHNDSLSEISNNLISTVWLFEIFFKSNPGGHVIFLSTGGGMYDMHKFSAPIDEGALPEPWSTHAINKLAAEHYLAMLCKKYNASATILRMSNLYGALFQSQRNQRVIGMAIASIKENKPFDIIESPQSLRDYLHLEDFAQCIKLVLKSKPRTTETVLYHVGTEKGTSIQSILELIGRAADKEFKTNISPTALQREPTYNVLDCKKIRDELGWSAKISLETGLTRLVSEAYPEQ